MLLLLCLIALSCTAQAAKADATCADMGFSPTLLCSDCEQLHNFVKDEALLAECRQCCAEDNVQQQEKFVSGTLDTCPHSLQSFPHINEFVNKKAAHFSPQLRLRTVVGVLPRLVMRDASGKNTRVDVSQWKTEHLEEFLQDKLQPPDASMPQQHVAVTQ